MTGQHARVEGRQVPSVEPRRITTRTYRRPQCQLPSQTAGRARVSPSRVAAGSTAGGPPDNKMCPGTHNTLREYTQFQTNNHKHTPAPSTHSLGYRAQQYGCSSHRPANKNPNTARRAHGNTAPCLAVDPPSVLQALPQRSLCVAASMGIGASSHSSAASYQPAVTATPKPP